MQPFSFPESAARGIRPIIRLSQSALVVAVIMLVQILPSVPSWAQETFTNDIGMEFVQIIPAGTFQMGGKASAYTVEISKPYYLGVHEVTQGQWRAVMGTAPWRGKSSGQQGEDYPAVYVNWSDAKAFVARLNAREGCGQCYRLPTEAEWEYATRAGTTTAYSFGDPAMRKSLNNYAWYEGNSGNQAHPVGEKRANAWGLYDMHGNVWEWVADLYDDYSPGAAVDPKGPRKSLAIFGTTPVYVIRGGSWANPAEYAFSAFRGYGARIARGNHIGFRLVREAL